MSNRNDMSYDRPLRTAEAVVARGDLPLLGQDPNMTYRLGIMGGTQIRIIAGGPDEEQAVDELVRLVNSGFAE